MDEFRIIIKKPLTFMLAHLSKFYYKINSFLAIHKAINKSYEPKLNEKVRINNLLSRKINDISNTNLKLISKIKKVDQENIALNKKINFMEELIIKK